MYEVEISMILTDSRSIWLSEILNGTYEIVSRWCTNLPVASCLQIL